jgi:hypothetical protein
MNARKIPALPADLESTRRRFDQWRQTCRVRTAIPGPLWAEAVKPAEQYGICRTAKALRVGGAPTAGGALGRHSRQDLGGSGLAAGESEILKIQLLLLRSD